MRKTALGLAVLFAIAVGGSALLDTPQAAGFGPCTPKCICSVPHRCCTVNGVTTCKPDPNSPLQCPQVAC